MKQRLSAAIRTAGMVMAVAGFLSMALSTPASAQEAPQPKPRVIVLTDIGNEPDDSESFVRFLLYTNVLDVEGLLATTSNWQRNTVQPQLLQERIDAYSKVLPNLRRHAPGYPEPAVLHQAVREGSRVYGLLGVGEGKDTPGSRLIVEATDRADPRPLYISVWGGAADLAQALWSVRATRSPEQVKAFVAKLRVYSISDQDDAGPWIRRNFPDLFWIASVHGWSQYSLATWQGISGDIFLANKWPGGDMVTNDWLATHVRRGPLGALYPPHQFIMEGDTPAFLWLIPNGLNAPEHPEWGGWGGRYISAYEGAGHRSDTLDRFTDEDGSTWAGNQATIYRWRRAFQNDFAARIAWSVSPEAGANHHPVVHLNGSSGLEPVTIRVKVGETVQLSAQGTSDPDGDRLSYRWFHYPEPGETSFPRKPPLEIAGMREAQASFVAPAVNVATDHHVILQVTDAGVPPLTSYRRFIVKVVP